MATSTKAGSEALGPDGKRSPKNRAKLQTPTSGEKQTQGGISGDAWEQTHPVLGMHGSWSPALPVHLHKGHCEIPAQEEAGLGGVYSGAVSR